MSDTLDLDSYSFVSASSSEGVGLIHHSSSDESLATRTYTTIRVEELGRLHATIANLQADERRRKTSIRREVEGYEKEARILRAKIRRLEDEKKMGWIVGLGALVLGLSLGVYVKFKMT